MYNLRRINLKSKPFQNTEVLIGDSLLVNLGSLVDFSKYSKVIIVSNQNKYSVHFKKIDKQVPVDLVILNVENNKSIDFENLLDSIFYELSANNVDKDTLIIGLGDQQILKISSICATNYLGGISLINIPMSIYIDLQCDLSYIEKEILDEKGYLDNFIAPIKIIFDMGDIKSLSRLELIDGFTLLVRLGLTFEKKFFHFVTSYDIEDFPQQDLYNLVEGGYRLEDEIITQSELDFASKVSRQFGRSIFNGLSNLNYKSEVMGQGECLAVSLFLSSQLSFELGFISKIELQTIKEAFENLGIPIQAGHFHGSRVIEEIIDEARNPYGEVEIVLSKGIGQGGIKKEVSRDYLEKVLL